MVYIGQTYNLWYLVIEKMEYEYEYDKCSNKTTYGKKDVSTVN